MKKFVFIVAFAALSAFGLLHAPQASAAGVSPGAVAEQTASDFKNVGWHGRWRSHNRWGSGGGGGGYYGHGRYRSHHRWGSGGGHYGHGRYRSHHRWGSGGGYYGHGRYRSHHRWGSRGW